MQPLPAPLLRMIAFIVAVQSSSEVQATFFDVSPPKSYSQCLSTGSNERGFSISKDDYPVHGSVEVPANYLGLRSMFRPPIPSRCRRKARVGSTFRSAENCRIVCGSANTGFRSWYRENLNSPLFSNRNTARPQVEFRSHIIRAEGTHQSQRCILGRLESTAFVKDN